MFNPFCSTIGYRDILHRGYNDVLELEKCETTGIRHVLEQMLILAGQQKNYDEY